MYENDRYLLLTGQGDYDVGPMLLGPYDGGPRLLGAPPIVVRTKKSGSTMNYGDYSKNGAKSTPITFMSPAPRVWIPRSSSLLSHENAPLDPVGLQQERFDRNVDAYGPNADEFTRTPVQVRLPTTPTTSRRGLAAQVRRVLLNKMLSGK